MSKVSAVQIVVYDIKQGSLSPRLQKELEQAIMEIVKQHDSLAYTVVTE